MTKQQILSLAEFDDAQSRIAYQRHDWPRNETISQHTMWTEGQRSENARLQPLIQTLVDDREALREAIIKAIARSDDYGDSWCSQPIREALLASDERMRKLGE